MVEFSVPSSQYHNQIKHWIKHGLLLQHYKSTKLVNAHYNAALKIWQPPKAKQEVLILEFEFGTRFIRKKFIPFYINFIKNYEHI